MNEGTDLLTDEKEVLGGFFKTLWNSESQGSLQPTRRPEE